MCEIFFLCTFSSSSFCCAERRAEKNNRGLFSHDLREVKRLTELEARDALTKKVENATASGKGLDTERRGQFLALRCS